jgi:hypothetical protein
VFDLRDEIHDSHAYLGLTSLSVHSWMYCPHGGFDGTPDASDRSDGGY